MPNRYCRNCGKELVEGAAFCMECGARADEQITVQQSPQPVSVPVPKKQRRGVSKRTVSILNSVLAAVLAVVLCVQAVLLCFVRPGWLLKKTEEQPIGVPELIDLSNADDIDGYGEYAGRETEFVETPVVSTQTLTVPEDGSAVTADCGAVIEMGAHNACFAEELTVTEYEPETEGLPDGVRHCYDINAGDVHEFDYYFDITLPYDAEGADPDDEEGSVFAEYYNEESEEWELIDCDVDTDNDTVTIHTNHLSKFTPVTIKHSDKMYAKLSKFTNLMVDDETALAELSARLDKKIDKFEEDPLVLAYMYYTVYFWSYADVLEYDEYINDEYIDKLKEMLPKATSFNAGMNWLASVGADALPYLDIVPSLADEFKLGKYYYKPSKMAEAAASFTDHMAAVAILDKINEEISSGEYIDKDGYVTASKGTIAELYGWLANYQASLVMLQLGMGFGSLVAIPAFLVDMLLEKVKSSYSKALNDAMANVVFYYYENRAGRPYLAKNEQRIKSNITGEVFKDEDGSDKVMKESWETRLLKAERKNMEKYNGDPDQLVAMINSQLSSDAYKAFTALANDESEINFAIAEGMKESDVKDLRISMIALSESRREAVCDKVALMIRGKLEKEKVLDKVASHMRADMRAQYTKWGSHMRSIMNFGHTIIIEEIIPQGEESTYGGCDIEFLASGGTVDLVRDAGHRDPADKTVVWKGKLDKNGGFMFYFTTAAYLKAGAPSELKVYDKKSGKVIVDVNFKVAQQTTKISLGQQTSEGHWEKVSETPYGSDHFVQIETEVTDIKVTIGRYEYNRTNSSVSNKEVATASPTPPEILVPGDEMSVTFTYREESNSPEGSSIWFEVNFLPDAGQVASDGRYSGSDAVSLVAIKPDEKTKDFSQTETFVIPDNSECKDGQMALQYIIFGGKNVFVYKWVDGITS